MLARAFARNPLHLAAFGRQVLTRNEAFFRQRLTAGGTWLMAVVDGRIAAVVHWEPEAGEPTRMTLGPLGVSPDLQRQGLGGRLMERYCADTDAQGLAGYLETDQVENLPFYERFGFEEVGVFPVSGVEQYVMWRPAMI